MTRLSAWIAEQDLWVSDALRRVATAGVATQEDADFVASQVQAAHGIQVSARLECVGFDEGCLSTAASSEELLLCSIGPLENVDRLKPDQELKFATDGLTIIFGENGSGKSGYARAARRLCTSRVPITLQSNVFETNTGSPTVGFKVKSGDDDPVMHNWIEGSELPSICSHISFLDTANARAYVESKTEILFLPPEIQCLTNLAHLYVLAANICQADADELTSLYKGPVGVQFDPRTSAGKLIASLVIDTPIARLPTVEQLRDAGVWNTTFAEQLVEIRRRLAESPAAQARTLRRLSESLNIVAQKANHAIALINNEELDHDVALVSSLKTAQSASDTFADEQAGRFPIESTGSETWRQLFFLARQFAAESDLLAEDEAFEIGDLCMLCQRPLDEQSRDRMGAFDTYIAAEAAAALEVAKSNVNKRVTQLRALVIDTEEQVLQALAEHRAADAELLEAAEGAAKASGALLEARNNIVAYLSGGPVVEKLPDMASLTQLSQMAMNLIQRAETLEKNGNVDIKAVETERELQDRETLAGCLDLICTRRNGLANRNRYLACVAALNTRAISRFASTLRSELVTPELRGRIERELVSLGLSHVPLRFTEQSASGKSFFEMALASTTRAKKSSVLSEGEQRALAIACFLADAHVSESSGAIIVDDPVTSLDHQRVRRVANRFAAEAASGRQIIIFTHNLLFYQEVLRACAEQNPQVPALPCLIQQSNDQFGLVSVDDQPWIAKKVRDRERALEQQLKALPDDLTPDSEETRVLAKQFYTDLRETWERAVEEIVLGGVVERFGTDVKTQSLKLVDVDDEDYRIIFFAMKRASERSGHDQAASKQIDAPTKEQMEADLNELRAFIATHRKKCNEASVRRKAIEKPPKAQVA